MSAITTHNLSKSFGKTQAVDQLNLNVKQKEIYGLVGPDGSGKTTVMRMLASILTPTSGDANVLGYSITTQGESIKNVIGYMSQRFGLYPDLTVSENIEFYADIYSVSENERKERKQELLDFSGLQPFQNRLAGNLSGGMKQKLGLTCALIHSPELLLLDEPTNGVDPLSRRDFWKILKDLQKQSVTILITTSYLDEAERCDHVGLMHEGKLYASSTVKEMRKLMPETLIEIQLENARTFFPAFQKEFGVSSVRLFGNKIHIHGTDPQAMMEKAHSLCQTLQIKPHHIDSIDPSLEDIFISVLTDAKKSH